MYWFNIMGDFCEILDILFVVMGDLYEIVISEDKLGGVSFSMERFRRIIYFKFNINTMDIPFTGNRFIWRKKGRLK